MHIVVSVNMDQNDYLAIQEPKRHQPLFAVIFPCVFAGDGEVVPDGLGPLEIQTVIFNIAAAFGLIPGGHAQSVVTICSDGKCGSHCGDGTMRSEV